MTKEEILEKNEIYGNPYVYSHKQVINAMQEYANQEKQGCDFVPYQLCPKCNGQGSVSKPGWVPGDVNQWTNSAVTHLCDICNGAKIIPMYVLPQKPEV